MGVTWGTRLVGLMVDQSGPDVFISSSLGDWLAELLFDQGGPVLPFLISSILGERPLGLLFDQFGPVLLLVFIPPLAKAQNKSKLQTFFEQIVEIS